MPSQDVQIEVQSPGLGDKSWENPFDCSLRTFKTVFVHKTVEYHNFYVKINSLHLVVCKWYLFILFLKSKSYFL